MKPFRSLHRKILMFGQRWNLNLVYDGSDGFDCYSVEVEKVYLNRTCCLRFDFCTKRSARRFFDRMYRDLNQGIICHIDSF